jgi:hypothetical protein
MKVVKMNVILTMTTVPNRMEHSLKKSVNRILDMPEDFELHINIPKVQASTEEEYIIPKWLKEISNPKLKIFDDVEDLGPRTKLIPTLLRVSNNSILITVDDDVVYRNGMISYHLDLRKKYPDDVTGFAGVGEDGKYYTSVKDNVNVAVLENYKTVSYNRSFFEKDFFEKYLDKSWNDDIITACYFRDKKRNKVVVKYEQETYFSPRVISFPIASLIETDFGGCDLFRNDSRKNTFTEILDQYNRV